MKKLSTLFILLFFMSTTATFAQPGTTIFYDDNFGPGGTLDYIADVNGRPSYGGPANGANVNIQWNSTLSQWEISITLGAMGGLTFVSTVNSMNPPNETLGMWVNVAGDGTVLEELSGDGAGSSLLPVELTYFTLIKKNKSLELQWQTSSELNNEKFEIEMSQDGRSFQKLGEVKGNGTTQITQNYSFKIDQPPYGVSYYRLKQMDFDGQFEYSDIVNANFEKISQSIGKIFPNPSRSGLVNLDLTVEESKVISISVVDLSGKILEDQVRQLEKGDHQLNFDFSSFPEGIYMIRFSTDESITTRKLILN
jgi:hypothetical protein